MTILFFKDDFYQATKKLSVVQKIASFLFGHTIHLVLLIRVGQSLDKLPFIGRLISFVIEYILRIIYSVDISLKAKIGPGLVISHGQNIVIGADVKIGNNCRIFNGVTLGNKDLTASSCGNQPIVKDFVIICTGAKILGSVVIHDNCIIGANAVVTKNCRPNSTYVGIPAREVK